MASMSGLNSLLQTAEDSLYRMTPSGQLHSLSFLILYSLLPYLLISLYSCRTTAFANTENSFAEASICGIILICLWFMGSISFKLFVKFVLIWVLQVEHLKQRTQHPHSKILTDTINVLPLGRRFWNRLFLFLFLNQRAKSIRFSQCIIIRLIRLDLGRSHQVL